jgi:hypothetical protein
MPKDLLKLTISLFGSGRVLQSLWGLIYTKTHQAPIAVNSRTHFNESMWT